MTSLAGSMPAPPRIFSIWPSGMKSSVLALRKTCPASPMFTAPGIWPFLNWSALRTSQMMAPCPAASATKAVSTIAPAAQAALASSIDSMVTSERFILGLLEWCSYVSTQLFVFVENYINRDRKEHDRRQHQHSVISPAHIRRYTLIALDRIGDDCGGEPGRAAYHPSALVDDCGDAGIGGAQHVAAGFKCARL